MPPTSGDIAAAHRIADWNTRHGAVHQRVGAALDNVIEATDRYQLSPSTLTHDELNRAGSQLAQHAQAALDGPATGVANYDDPWREGLRAYVNAGHHLAQFDPTDETTDKGFNAGILIARGRELTSVATEYTQRLVQRLQRG